MAAYVGSSSGLTCIANARDPAMPAEARKFGELRTTADAPMNSKKAQPAVSVYVQTTSTKVQEKESDGNGKDAMDVKRTKKGHAAKKAKLLQAAMQSYTFKAGPAPYVPSADCDPALAFGGTEADYDSDGVEDLNNTKNNNDNNDSFFDVSALRPALVQPIKAPVDKDKAKVNAAAAAGAGAGSGAGAAASVSAAASTVDPNTNPNKNPANMNTKDHADVTDTKDTKDPNKQMTKANLQRVLDQVPYLKELPLFPELADICMSIATCPVTLVSAPTGSGKTVGIPHTLLWALENQLLSDTTPIKRVFVAIPNSVIADAQFRRSCVSIMSMFPDDKAKLNRLLFSFSLISGEKKTKLEKLLDPHPQIIYGTYEAISAHLLELHIQKSPLLHNSIVMMDETHNVSEQLSVLMSHVQLIMLAGVRLKTVMTSATPFPSRFGVLTKPNIIHSQVEGLPVRTYWQGSDVEELFRPWAKGFTFSFSKIKSRVLGIVRDILGKQNQKEYSLKHNKDILIFASGENEVEELAQSIAEQYGDAVCVLPCYAHLEPAKRALVFVERAKLTANGARKIIIATDRLQSGLTIPGVGYVISTLVHKTNVIVDNCSMLVETVIPTSSLIQQRGRVGRVKEVEAAAAPDEYFPLCTESFYQHEMPTGHVSTYATCKKHKLVLRWMTMKCDEHTVIQLMNEAVVTEMNHDQLRVEYDSVVNELLRLKLVFYARDGVAHINDYGRRVMKSPLSLEGAAMVEWCTDFRYFPFVTAEQQNAQQTMLTDAVHLLISVVASDVMRTQSHLWRFPFFSQQQKASQNEMTDEQKKQLRDDLKSEFLAKKRLEFGADNDLLVIVNIFGRMLFDLASKGVDVFGQGVHESAQTKDEEVEAAQSTEWWVISGAWCRAHGVENKIVSAFFNLWRSVMFRLAKAWVAPVEGSNEGKHRKHDKHGNKKKDDRDHKGCLAPLFTLPKGASQRDLLALVLLHTDMHPTFQKWQSLWSFVFVHRIHMRCEPSARAGEQGPVMYTTNECDYERCRIDNKSLSLLGEMTVAQAPMSIIALNKQVFQSGTRSFTVLSMCFPCEVPVYDAAQDD